MRITLTAAHAPAMSARRFSLFRSASRDDTSRKHLELPVLVAVAVAGAAAAFGVLRLHGLSDGRQVLPFGYWAHDEFKGYRAGDVFKDSGEFKMWLFLIAAQTALWAVAAVVLLSESMRRPLREVWPRARKHVAVGVTAAAVPLFGTVGFASVHSKIDYPLPWHQEKVLALSAIGLGVALIGIGEMVVVKFALDHDPPVGGSAADVARYLELRALLQRILGIEGAIIGAAVLATGALRNAVVAYDGVLATNGVLSSDTFPREYVLIYGAFFTAMLALLYAPVYFRLLEVGRANVDKSCKAEEPGSAAWLQSYEKRARLEEHLQLEIATSASFRTGVAILAPLASALVALLLGAA